MGALLRHRDVRLLFVGLTVSMVGDSLMLLVFAIWVKTLTGSNGAAGAVLISLLDYRLLLVVIVAGMLSAAAHLWTGAARRLPQG